MKTFKLIAFNLLKDNDTIEIPLEDGLIINKEDESHTWLMEVFTDRSYHDLFYSAIDQGNDLLVQVIITNKDNPPAPFQVKAKSLQCFKDNISVLFEGTLKRSRNNYSEEILQELILKGFSGDELLSEFKNQMHLKPASKQN